MKIHCQYSELVEVAGLKEHPKNSNKHPTDQIERLARILEYQGWRYPVKVSRQTGYVTSGHGRILAAKLNGWKEVPVSFQDYEDETQEWADVTSDNAIASWAELDLSTINAFVPDMGPDFDLDLLGIKGFTLEPKADFGDEDAVGETPIEPKVKRGELWILGSHKLLIDDCTIASNVERLMGGEKADMVFTDPPYNVEYDYNFSEDDRTDEEYLSFLTLAFGAIPAKEDCAWYCKNAPRNLPSFLPLATNLKWEMKNLIVWPHTSWISNQNRFLDNWEAICLFYRGKPTFHPKAQTRVGVHSIDPMRGHHGEEKLDCRYSDVWDDVQFISAGAMASKEAILKPGSKSKAHPCQMPIALAERGIAFSSDVGDLVYEAFCGSGTTLIAAEKTERKCRAIELDPLYGELIINRWQKFTGREAVREDGVKFSELA